MLLTSSYQGDDFQPVAVGQPVPGVALAGHQLEIGLDGHVLIGQGELLEQLGDRCPLGYPAELTVDGDFHVSDPHKTFERKPSEIGTDLAPSPAAILGRE
jgi:hypothetical protein